MSLTGGSLLSFLLLEVSACFAQGIHSRAVVNHTLVRLMHFCISAVIVNNPNNKTVFLNQSAVFTCETDGGISGWRVNGTLSGDLPPAVQNILEFSSTNTDEGTTLLKLTIPARAECNNTRVQCVSGTFGGSSVESETAILKVQGTTYVAIA